MFPAKFDYHRARTVPEALDLLGQIDGSKLIAGGHSLLPMMKLRLAQPTAVIDISRIDELTGIDASGDVIRIGALTCHADVAASKEIEKHCRVLHEAAGEIGDPQVRNKGTVGGNIAHADPASDLPGVLLALGAAVHVRGKGGERSIPAKDFFLDLLYTDLRPDEILTAVTVPKLPKHTGSAYLKVEHPASGYALCGAAAVVSVDGKRVTAASVAFNGIANTPVHAESVGWALSAQGDGDGDVGPAVLEGFSVADPLSDIYASGEYRVHLARVYGARALDLARSRA